jgi:uncharacterized cofD-like protein
MAEENNKQGYINLVTIGGGKGQASILEGLKKYSYRLNLSAIVSMVDNGGSTGKLREELGIPSFGGDFRDVLTSLSHNQTINDLFHHRYEYGSEIKGHSVGNLILLGLLEQCDWDIPKAIEIAKDILDITRAEVLPSTLDQTDLVAEYEDGEVIKGQDEIDNNMQKMSKPIKNVTLNPEPKAYSKAVEAIAEADAILLCPGDLYGSLICNLIVPGINEAIASNRKAKVIYVSNLMGKIYQKDWTASMFIREVQKYLHGNLDYAIVNTGNLSEDISKKEAYAKENWQMVESDIDGNEFDGVEIIKGSIWYEGQEFKRVSTDVIPRSFIRHDPVKIAEIVMGLIG